ncbi:MAG: cyclic nucleotide-binding domain-containing protein [Bacillota bacterium]|nr:cyclic nucleotide-binding domain-containing protein [Bacillota bacterium]
MKKCVVIPTYWGRKKGEKSQVGDGIYDHPTPIDEEGTLQRTLESMKILYDKKFKLVILVCPVSKDVEEEAVENVYTIIEKAKIPEIETYIFTPETLRNIQNVLLENGLDDIELLSLNGYSNIRNMCVYSTQLLAADVAILIDDDEVFENPNYITMASEHIGMRKYGKMIYGVAGYYLNKFDEFYDDVDIVPWMTYWNRFGSKTEAFDTIIGKGPRMKVTPFAFGGAMVIHKNLFQLVPFDPEIRRGEDIDYLMNAKMFGYDFFLDNELNIKHLPPPKSNPIWKRFREDIYRFLFEQNKINNQKDINYMNEVSSKDFDPYPGDFLKNDLEDKIFKTNVLLALDYLSKGDVEGCQESIKNVYLSKYEAKPHFDVFDNYMKTQKKWVSLMKKTIKYRRSLRKVMEEFNLTRKQIEVNMESYENITEQDKIDRFKLHHLFNKFTDEEIKIIAEMSELKVYNENDIIFRSDDNDLFIYAVIKGCVRIIKCSSKGEEIFLASVCSNSIIGETSLLKDKFNSTGIADEFVVLMRISKGDMESLIASNPVIGNKLMGMFLERMYMKLSSTSVMYRDKLVKEEHIED